MGEVNIPPPAQKWGFARLLLPPQNRVKIQNVWVKYLTIDLAIYWEM